jgi:5-methylcytosine-specific restriction protein A
MLKSSAKLIVSELAYGTGASIAVEVSPKGLRAGLDIWFNDLNRNNGPIVEVRSYGLRAHKICLYFGRFSKSILDQISAAPAEAEMLARSLVASIRSDANIEVTGQALEDWIIKDAKFSINALLTHAQSSDSDESILTACRDVIMPLMAAMAELIGYDEIVPGEHGGEMEGAITKVDVLRRERNPRNRLLALRVHGAYCACCLVDPMVRYGGAGNILEVHHLQPLSELSKPRIYNPSSDLVPLCPNCHRAAHTRRPTPIPIDELRSMLALKC